MNLKIALRSSEQDIMRTRVGGSWGMQARKCEVKDHIVSTRISAVELETLCEMKKSLELDSISDLVRVALQRLSESVAVFDTDSTQRRDSRSVS